jgi:Ca-activated chloride channel homolog
MFSRSVLMRSRLAGFPVIFATILGILLLGSYARRARGQTEPAAGGAAKDSPQAIPRFNASTTLVLIPVTVTDPLNRFVLGLRQQDFHIFEDGAEQTISHLSGEDTPLSVGLLFDTSGSMSYKLQTSRQAATQFLKTMNPQDEAFLISFSDKATLSAGFTSNSVEIQDKLEQLQPGGLTAMLDAIDMALREMKNAKNPRKAILIVSDGGDNHSRYTSSQIQALVREADVQVYAMGVFEPVFSIGLSQEEVTGPKLLSELAEQTGGRAFTAVDPSDLPSIAARIGIELRNQYVLAYSPKNQERDGKFRRVEVKVTQPAGLPAIKVHWRQGYYAPSE